MDPQEPHVAEALLAALARALVPLDLSDQPGGRGDQAAQQFLVGGVSIDSTAALIKSAVIATWAARHMHRDV